MKNPILTVKNEAIKLAVDLESVKNFLKIDFENDDLLITKLIKTATNQCETHINKTLIEKKYVYSLYELRSTFVNLPYSPIRSVEEVRLVKKNNISFVLEENTYFLDIVAGILNFKNKPNNLYRLDIEYIAGLECINEELIQGLLIHIARMYEDRSGYSQIPLSSLNIYKKYKQIKL